MYDFYTVFSLFFLGFVFVFMVYTMIKQSRASKKTFDYIDESHRIGRESIEISKKMLKELETISKNLKK
jgi:hypothetical protein